MISQEEEFRRNIQSYDQPDNLNHSVNKSHTRIIAVTSGKGGVGKTNISTSLAIAYARVGKRVVLMDADLGLANVNVVLGIIPKYTLYDLIRKKRTLNDIIEETNYGFRIIAGASGFSPMVHIGDKERAHLIQEMSALADADIIIIDTGAGVSHNVLAFVRAAHETIIVTTPEPTSITDAYGIIKIISNDIQDLGLGMKLVVNRVKSAIEGTRVSRRVIDIAAQFLNVKIEYVGHVYEDDAIHQAVLQQRPFSVIEPKGKASICIQHIVGRIERIDAKGMGGIARFLERIFGSNST